MLCVGQPSAQHREEPTVPEVTVYMFKARGVPEILKKMMVKHLQAKRSTAQNHQPPVQSQIASTQQAKAESGAAVPKQSSHAGREPRRTFYSAFPARIAHPCSCQVHEPDQQVTDDSSVSSQSHREVVTGDRPADQRPKREDRGLRRP